LKRLNTDMIDLCMFFTGNVLAELDPCCKGH
jgi:hypothetical protein